MNTPVKKGGYGARCARPTVATSVPVIYHPEANDIHLLIVQLH